MNLNVIVFLTFVFSQSLLGLDKGLPNIEYEFVTKGSYYSNNDLLVNLAERGDIASQRYLADRLSVGSIENKKNAINWYKMAFNDGRGDVTVLAAMAQAAYEIPENSDIKEWLHLSIEKLTIKESLQIINTVLEVNYYFPGILSEEEFTDLVQTHAAACLGNCKDKLYFAEYYLNKGELDSAVFYYSEAMIQDERAVDKFYLFSGEDRSTIFRLRTSNLKTDFSIINTNSIARIAEVLIDLAELDQENGTGDGYDDQVDIWLDQAMQRNSVRAFKAKLQYMLVFPTYYNHNLYRDVIEKYQKTSPNWSRYFDALGKMEMEWRNIDAKYARKTLEELEKQGFKPAYLGLGKLESEGIEDQPDQIKALEYFHKGQLSGLYQAYYQAASIYSSGKSICHDLPKAWAYNEIAYLNGVVIAVENKPKLEKTMSEKELEMAKLIFNELIQEHKEWL